MPHCNIKIFAYLFFSCLVAIIVKLVSFRPINPAVAHTMPRYGISATLVNRVPPTAAGWTEKPP